MHDYLQISYFRKLKGKKVRMYLSDGTIEIGRIVDYDDVIIVINDTDSKCEKVIFKNHVMVIETMDWR